MKRSAIVVFWVCLLSLLAPLPADAGRLVLGPSRGGVQGFTQNGGPGQVVKKQPVFVGTATSKSSQGTTGLVSPPPKVVHGFHNDQETFVRVEARGLAPIVTTTSQGLDLALSVASIVHGYVEPSTLASELQQLLGVSVGQHHDARHELYVDAQRPFDLAYLAWRGHHEGRVILGQSELTSLNRLFADRVEVLYPDETTIEFYGRPDLDPASRLTDGPDGPPVVEAGTYVIYYVIQRGAGSDLLYHPEQQRLPPFVGFVEKNDGVTELGLREAENASVAG